MRSPRTIAVLAFASTLALPAQAFGATLDDGGVVPQWLSITVGVVSLGIAVMLLTDAVLLRRVAEGSIVADNIAYMMSGVVCFGVSVLVRWIALFTEDVSVSAQMSWASDLLVTVGMALLAVYFMRVRLALSRYLKSIASAYPGASDVESPDSDASGEDIGG